MRPLNNSITSFCIPLKQPGTQRPRMKNSCSCRPQLEHEIRLLWLNKKGFKSINRSGEIVAHLIHIISSFTLVTCVHNLMIVTRNYYMPRGLGSRFLSRDLKDKIHSFLPSLFLPSLSSSLALCLSRSLSASIEDNSRCWLLIISNIVNASANENSLLKVKTSHLPNKNNQEQKQERWVRGQRVFKPFLNWSWEKILHQRHVQ